MSSAARPIAASVAAISFVTLLSEIALTKVISYVLFYPFTYLLIGFALLGLGFGAAWVALESEWQWTRDRAATCLCVFALGIGLAPLALAHLPLDLENIFGGVGDVVAWLALVIALVAPFVSSGVLLSTAFRAGAVRPGLLYAADLGFAALASLLAIPVLVVLGPVRAMALAAAVALAVAWWLAQSRSRVVAAAVVAGLVHGYLSVNHLSAFTPAPGKRMEDMWDAHKVVYSSWHPLFRVDVSSEWLVPTGISRCDLLHDGNIGSGFIKVPNAAAASRTWDGTIKQVPHLIAEAPRVLVIGAAGGGDLMIARHYGASHVTGVELHPLTTDLIYGAYADFSGQLVQQPNVDYINAEGRRFVELTDEQFDLIQLVSPDSYSAQPGASQVLVENYLYTREAFRAYWDALSPKGILAFEIGDVLESFFSQNMMRTVSQARDLLVDVGVGDPEKHLLVAIETKFFRVSNVIISKAPFEAAAVARVLEGTRDTKVEIVWNPLAPKRLTPVGHLASGGDLREMHKHRFGGFNPGVLDLRPVDDDRPFFFTYYKWLSLLRGQKWGMTREYATGQYLLLLLLLIAGLAVASSMVVPLFFRQRGIPLGMVWSMGTAVAILGWAFLAIEVNTIQRLTLYLGYPTYSLTAVLSGVLLGAGLGSALSGQVETAKVLKGGAALVIVFAFASGSVLPAILDATFGFALPLRISIAVVWAIAQGIGLGVFFPTALQILGGWGPRWVAWGWTVNGAASVFGSALAVFMAMLVGFRYGALLAGVGYLLAAGLLLRAHALAVANPPRSGSESCGI